MFEFPYQYSGRFRVPTRVEIRVKMSSFRPTVRWPVVFVRPVVACVFVRTKNRFVRVGSPTVDRSNDEWSECLHRTKTNPFAFFFELGSRSCALKLFSRWLCGRQSVNITFSGCMPTCVFCVCHLFINVMCQLLWLKYRIGMRQANDNVP